MKNPQYSKILVCCDGSKYSERAINHACNLAKKDGSSLSLIYVVDRSVGLDLFDRREYLKVLKNYGVKVLKRSGWIISQKGVKGSTVLKEGKVADEIVKYAKKGNFQLIVVGSKGLGAVSRLFLGSVSTKIAQHSLCSVLIVK
jgi:nucleotide-binding universal stress UspA family protein